MKPPLPRHRAPDPGGAKIFRRTVTWRCTAIRTLGAVLATTVTVGVLSAVPAAADGAAPSPATVSLANVAATADDHLFALAADHSAVYERTSDNSWTKVGGPAKDLYAGRAGLFATDPNTGNINKYDGTPDHWTNVGDPGATFAVSSDHLYGLTPDRSAVMQWNGKGKDWTKIGGPAKDLYAGGAGLFATNPDTGDINHYDGEPDHWSRAGGPGATFTVGSDHLYGLTPDRSAVMQWNGKDNDWTKIDGAAKDLYAGKVGLFATDPGTGKLTKYSGTPDTWDTIGEPGTTFAVSDQHLYGLTPDRSAVYQWSGKGTDWTALGAPAFPKAHSSPSPARGPAPQAAHPIPSPPPAPSPSAPTDPKPAAPTPATPVGADSLCVTAQDDVYALAADHNSVWKREHNHWTRIGGPAKTVQAGRAGVFAVAPDSGKVYRYDNDPDHWTEIKAEGQDDGVADLKVVGNHVYRLAANHGAVYEWSKGTGKWTEISGPAKDLYAGGAGLFATNPQDGSLNRYAQENREWKRVGDPGAAFAVGDKHLYRLNPDRSAVYEWAGKGTEWTRIGGPAKDLYAGGAGLFATNPDTGDIYKYNGHWSHAGGPGSTFAVSDKHLYGLTPDRSTVTGWDGKDGAWTSLGAPGETSYERAKQTGFTGKAPEGSQRKELHGKPGADNGIIMARFFIPTKTAAENMLYGDDREFSNDPDESAYRMVLFWDTATGEATFTVTQSTKTEFGRAVLTPTVVSFFEGFGKDVPARPIHVGEDNNRWTWRTVISPKRIDGSELHMKIHGINSVLPLFAADVELTIKLDPQGSIAVERKGDAYPNMEVLQYKPGLTPSILARDEMASRNPWKNGWAAAPRFSNVDRAWTNGIRTRG